MEILKLQEIQNTYDEIAAEFDITRYKPWPQTVKFIESLPSNGTILDLGCGNGRNIDFLVRTQSDFRIIGLDFSKRLLRIAKEKLKRVQLNNEINFVLGDVVKLPLNSSSLDGVLYVATLHHIPSAKLREASLIELQRCLKPGARAFISVWDFEQERFKEELENQLSGTQIDSEGEFGDVLVPWIGKRGTSRKRFYHMFYQNELEELIGKTKLELDEIFRANDNFHAVVRKKH